jgi:potassium efflux system protein
MLLRLLAVFGLVVHLALPASTFAETKPAPAPDAAAAVVDSADDWIRPEDVADRSDALAPNLDEARPSAATVALLESIDTALTRLDPDLDSALEHARVALSGQASLLAIRDLRRELEGDAEPFAVWKEQLATEAKRVADLLTLITQAQRRWTLTLAHPETAAAGAAVVKRAESSLSLIAQSITVLQAWRVRVLALNDRLGERITAVNDALAKLQAATVSEGMHLLVPDEPPIWQRSIGNLVARELPQISGRLADFHRSTRDYFTRDWRPFLLQPLIAILLMFVFGRFPERDRGQLSAEQSSSGTARLLDRPYAIAVLFALALSPVLHPAAPRRVIQLLGVLTLLPVARILMLASERMNLAVVLGLVVLLLLDRLAIALTALPGITLILFLFSQCFALALAFQYRCRLRASGESPWMEGILSLAMSGFVLAILAEIGGWSTLASLFGRGVLASGVITLYIFAIALSLEAIFAYVLSSPALRRSRFVDRNQDLVQRWTSIALRLICTAFWITLVLNALGLRDITFDALSSMLEAGVSVGALSLSLGGVLAFVVTLVVAMIISRIVHEVLEDEIFPRTNLPRGIPNALMTLTSYAIYSLGFLLALAAAGVQLGQLSILLGGLGVGLGFGLQDLVKNFAAGITLLFERRVHVGDAVQIPEKNVFGRVLSIGMRASVVRNWNGAEVVMPNDDLVASSITNWTLSDRLHRVEVQVGVAYSSDPEQVIEVLLGVAGTCKWAASHPPPAALFLGFGDSASTLR